LYLCKKDKFINKNKIDMKKYLFLIVIIGTLISFSACKKEEESMIIGKWELTSIHCDNCLEVLWIPCVYEFCENNRFSCKGENRRPERGKYFMKNDTITFETTYRYSKEISFPDSKTMKWN